MEAQVKILKQAECLKLPCPLSGLAALVNAGKSLHEISESALKNNQLKTNGVDGISLGIGASMGPKKTELNLSVACAKCINNGEGIKTIEIVEPVPPLSEESRKDIRRRVNQYNISGE